MVKIDENANQSNGPFGIKCEHDHLSPMSKIESDENATVGYSTLHVDYNTDYQSPPPPPGICI